MLGPEQRRGRHRSQQVGFHRLRLALCAKAS
jgi:hypothetical protein